MATPLCKQFKVTNHSRQKTCLMLYRGYDEFVSKCKNKFGIPDEASVHFVLEDDTGTEVDSQIIEENLPEKSLLIMNEDNLPHDRSDGSVKRQKGQKRQLEDEIDDTKETAVPGGSLQENTVLVASNDRRASQFDGDDVRLGKSGTELKKHAAKFGLDNIGNILKDNLDKWKTKPLNIAVLGAPGKGKSSLINAFRGLKEIDPGSAKVGTKKTTSTISSYRYPRMNDFLIWDVPGVGTKEFPKDSYIKAIKADRFDFFIIVIAERFTETDAWLCQEVKRRNPFHRCYIVRTKVDNDLRSEKRKLRNGEHFDEREKFKELKRWYFAEIKDSIPSFPEFSFFLVSNHHVEKFDIPELKKQLLKDVPMEKRNTMLFGVVSLSLEIVKEKATALRSRVWKIAMLSGTGALIPIPFLSSGTNVSLVWNEILFYREQFGLTDESLRKLAKNVSLDEFKVSLQLQTSNGWHIVFLTVRL